MKTNVKKKRVNFEEEIIEDNVVVEEKNNEEINEEIENTNDEMEEALKEFDSILDKINLESIECINSEKVEKISTNISKALTDLTPFKQVPCLQSGILARMRGATLEELDLIAETDADAVTIQETLYKILHRLMVDSSVGKLTFDEFLDQVSFGDLDTLVYGIYCQTIKKGTKVNVRCYNFLRDSENPKSKGKICGHQNNFHQDNESLICINDDEIYSEIRKHLFEYTKEAKEIQKEAPLFKIKRIPIKKGRIIFEVGLMSLRDHLSFLKILASDKNIKKRIASCVAYTKSIYVLNEEKSLERKSPIFDKITKKDAIINIIKQIPTEEGLDLYKEIEELADKYIIRYAIPKFNCQKCGNPIENVSVELQEWLFELALRGKD